MLNSKKIGLITGVLVIIALAFSVYFVVTPDKNGADGNSLVFENGQSVEFTSSDYYSDTLLKTAKKIAPSSDEVVISGGGVYEFSGEYTGGIRVESDSGEVILLLNGASVKSDECAIWIEQSDKTVIALAPGSENNISDGENRSDITQNGAIFSRDDLVFCGEGELNINAAHSDAIKVNDSLKIMGGNIIINAPDEGINVNDSIILSDGSITVKSGGHAIKCENTENENLGFVAALGGNLSVESEKDGIWASGDIYLENTSAVLSVYDDGVHTEKTLFLNGGEISVESCTEGFEGKYIVMNDGKYSIVSSDDAINAAGEGSFMMSRHQDGETTAETYLTINGGTLYACVGGDGLDSNGAAIINGGYVEVYGPENGGNSTLDFDGGFQLNGGSVIAAGSSAMASSPSESSKQNSVTVYLNTTYERGTKISLLDENGEEILSSVAEKSFDWLCLSSDKIKLGSRYSVRVGDNIEMDEELSSAATVVGRNSFRGGMPGTF